MSYYNGFSENYQTYIKKLRTQAFEEELEKSLSPYTYKDYTERTEGLGQIAATQRVNYLDFVFDSVSPKQIKDHYVTQRQNILSPFKYSATEHSQRIEADKKTAEELALRLKQDRENPETSVWLDTTSRMSEQFEKAISDPENAWRHLPDNDLYEEVPLGSEIGTRILDLSTMYQASKFFNNMNADIMGSILADSGRVSGAKARDMLIHPEFKTMLDNVSKIVGVSTNELFRQEEVDAIVTHIHDDPGDWQILEMFSDALINIFGEEEATIWESFGPWNEGEWDLILKRQDKIWIGTDTEPGQREVIASAIEGMVTNNEEVATYLQENPDFIEDIRRSKNPLALVKAMNNRRQNAISADYIARSSGRFGVGGTLNMLGYGFTTDPTIGIEIAATLGFALPAKLALKGVQLVPRGLAAISKVEDAVSTASKFNRTRRFINGAAYRTDQWLGQAIDKTFTLAPRLLPSRILSDLVVPSSAALFKSGKFKNSGKGFYAFLKDNKYLPETTGGKFVYRGLTGAFEGTLWGAAEYSYMTKYEDAMNEMMFGEEAANIMAMQRNEAGAFYHMVGAGALLGGIMSPTLGMAFDNAGSGIGTVARSVGSKYAEMSLNTDSWVGGLNKLIIKGINKAREVGNLLAPNEVDSMTAAAGQLIVRKLDANSRKGFVGPIPKDAPPLIPEESVRFLNGRLVDLGNVARRAGHNFYKIVKEVVSEIPEGEQLSAWEITTRIKDRLIAKEKAQLGRSKIQRDLAITAQERLQRGWTANGDLAEKAGEAAARNREQSDAIRRGREGVRRLARNRRKPVTRWDNREEANSPRLEQPNKSPEQIALEQRMEQATEARNAANEARASAETNANEAEKALAKAQEKIDKATRTLKDKNATAKQKEKAQKRLEEGQAAKETAQNKLDGANEALEKADGDFSSATDDYFSAASAAALSDVDGTAEAIGKYRDMLFDAVFFRTKPDDLGRVGAFETLRQLKEQGTTEIPLVLFKRFFPDEWLKRMRSNLEDEDLIKTIDDILNNSTEEIAINQATTLLNKLRDANSEFLVLRDISDADHEFAVYYRATGDEEMAFKKAQEVARYEELADSGIITREEAQVRELTPEQLFEIKKKQEETKERIQKLREAFKEEGSLDLVIDELSSASLIEIRKQINAQLPRNKRIGSHLRSKAALLPVIKEKLAEAGRTQIEMEARIVEYFDGNFDAAVQREVLGLVEDEVELNKSSIMSNYRKNQRRANQRYMNDWNEWKDLVTRRKEEEAVEDVRVKNYDLIRRLKGKEEAAWQKLVRHYKSMNESLNKQWPEIKKKEVQKKIGKISIENRPNPGHIGPLIRLTQLLSGYAIRNKQMFRRVDGVLEYDMSISRSDLISILNEEEGYVALMYAIEDRFGANMTRYDARDVMGVIFEKLAKTNNVLGDTLRNDFERLLEHRYMKARPGTADVYTGRYGQLTNLLKSNLEQQEGKARYAQAKHRETGGAWAGDETASTVNRSVWNEQFRGRLKRIVDNSISSENPNSEVAQKLRAILGDVDLDDINAVSDRLREAINEQLPVGRQLTSFDQLGSTVDWVGPNRAALGVVQALTSRKATANRVRGTEVIVGDSPAGSRNEVRRTLGARRDENIGIQELSDKTYIQDKQEFEYNSRVGHILSAETAQDFASLEAWIKSFSQEDLEEITAFTGPRDMGLAVLPSWGISRASDEMPFGWDKWVSYNQDKMMEYAPSFFFTVHDALYPQYSTLMTGQGARGNARAFPNWDLTLEGDDGKTFYPMRGIGFGFGTMLSRGGTMEDAINVATAITFGYKDLIDVARKNWNKFAREAGVELGIDDDPIAWVYKNYEGLDESKKRLLVETLFPDIKYDDANASGSNIMLALYAGDKGSSQVKTLFKEIISKHAMDDPEGFDNLLKQAVGGDGDGLETTYSLVEKFVRDQFTGEKLEKLKANITDKTQIDSLEAIAKIMALSSDDVNFKNLFKRPAMTDLYWAGRGSMSEAMMKEFFLDVDVKAALEAEGVFKGDYKEEATKAAWVLAGLLNDNGDKAVNGWIKSVVFGEGTKVTNQQLSDMLTNRSPIKIDDQETKPIAYALGDEVGQRQAGKELLDSDKVEGAVTASMFGGGHADPNQAFNNFIAEAMGRIRILEKAGHARENTKLNLIQMMKEVGNTLTNDPALQNSLKNGDWEAANTRYNELINKYRVDHEKIVAFNRYARQGFSFNEDSFKTLLTFMFAGDQELARSTLDNLPPLARRAFNNTFYRTLGMDVAGRMYSNSPNDPIQIKGFRPYDPEESPLGVLQLDRETAEFLDPENIKRLVILDTAIKLAELTDKLPAVGNKQYEPSSWEKFYSSYEQDSINAETMRAKAGEALKAIRATTPEDLLQAAENYVRNQNGISSQILPRSPEAAEEFTVQMKKLLARLIDSTAEARPDELKDTIEIAVGSDNPIQTARMPGHLGYLPRTYQHPFEGTPIPLLRGVQLELDNDVKEMRKIERLAKLPKERATEAVFSADELAWSAGREGIEDLNPASIVPIKESLKDSFLMTMTSAPDLVTATEVVKNDLILFGRQMGASKLNIKQGHDLLLNGDWDKLLLLKHAVMAKTEALKGQEAIEIAAAKVRAIEERIKEQNKNASEAELRNEFESDQAWLKASRALDRTIDAASIMQEESMRSLVQWGWDAQNKVTDLVSFEGQTLDMIYSGRTMEEAMGRLAQDNLTTGNLIAWLAGDAKKWGEIIAGDGEWTANAGYGKLARTAQAMDSTVLYLMNYAQAYTHRYAIKKLRPELETVTSLEVQNFVKWWDAVLRNNVDEIDPEVAEIYKDFSIKDVQDLLDEGGMRAYEDFSSQSALADILGSMELAQIVKAKLKTDYFSDTQGRGLLEEKLQTSNIDVTLEDLMTRKGKYIGEKDALNVFVTPFGEVLAPHKVIGEVFVRLTSDQKRVALNYIGNIRALDRIKLANAIGASKLPINADVASNISGYDPFTSYGLSLNQVRDNAALTTAAIRKLHERSGTEGRLNLISDNRYTVRDGSSTMSAQFLKFNNFEIEEAFKLADEILAKDVEKNLQKKIGDGFYFNTLQPMKSEWDSKGWGSSYNEALNLLPMISNSDRGFNVFYRQHVLRRQLLDENKNISKAEAFELYNEKIQPILSSVYRAMNEQAQDATDSVSTTEYRRSPNDHYLDELEAETINNLNAALDSTVVDFNVSPEVLQMLYPDTSSSMASHAAKREITLADIDSKLSDSNEAMSGINNIYNRELSARGFGDISPEHEKFNGLLEYLRKTNVIDNKDVYLLRATFMHDETKLRQFFETNYIMDKRGVDERIGVTGARNYYQQEIKAGEGIVERIDFARDLSKNLNDGQELTAVGVILEEIGHAIGARLTPEDRKNFFIRTKELFVTDKNKELFDQLEQTIYGEDSTVDARGLTSRGEQLDKELRDITGGRIKDMEIVTEGELFGTLFALSMMGRNKIDLDVINDTTVVTQLLQESGNALARYKEYQKALSNFGEADRIKFDDISKAENKLLEQFKPFRDLGGGDISVMSLHNRAGMGAENDLEPNRALQDDEARLQNDFTHEQRSFAREADNMDRIDEFIENAMDEEGFLDPNLIADPSDRAQAQFRFVENTLERIGVGNRWDTPVSNVINALTYGFISKNRMASFIENIAAPFGARKFAFQTDGTNNMTALMQALLQTLDQTMLITSGSFSKAVPTLQGIKSRLDMTFEPLETMFNQIRAQNATGLDEGRNAYTLFSQVWKEVVLNRGVVSTREDGSVIRSETPQGWQGEARATEIAMSALTRNGFSDLTPDDALVTTLVQSAKMWSDPKTGVWSEILTALVDAGTLDRKLADKLLKEGVYPIKFADSVFGNTEQTSVSSREAFREDLSNYIREQMKGSDRLNEDIFRIAFAELFTGTEPEQKQALRKLRFGSFVEERYTRESFITGMQRLLVDIKRGKVTAKDLFTSPEEKQRYYGILDQGVKAYTGDDPLKREMMNTIIREIDETSTKSQKRAYTSINPSAASDVVAMRYMARMGSSAYAFTGDAFLTPAAMLDNPNIAKYIEIDPVAIMSSVKKGVAAQAFDRQIYGNLFKVRGMGMGDVLNMLRPIAEDSSAPYTLMLGKDMEVGSKRHLNPEETKKFRYALNHMTDAYRFAMGTLGPVDTDTAVPIINMMVKAGQIGSALSVGPRLAMAAFIEETPMAVTATLKNNLTNMRNNIAETLMVAKKKDDVYEYLKGLGFIAQEMRHQANTIMAQTGDVMDANTTNFAKKAYKFTAMGLNRQVFAARAQGVRMFINNLDRFFDSYRGFTTIDGQEIFDASAVLHPTFDTLVRAVRNLGDPENITKKDLDKVFDKLKLNNELRLHATDMLKLGLLSEELAPILKEMYLNNRNDIVKLGIPFDKLRNDITFDSTLSRTERAQKLQVVNSLAELAWTNATRYAKQPTLSQQPFGARTLGPFGPLMTMLTTYASTVYSNLRRLMGGSAALAAGAFMAHAMSGYLYYKLVQLQMSKSLDDMINEMRKDPMGEIQDALMSVPFFGMNQMAIASLLNVLRGERPANTQILGVAGLSMVNRILQLPKRLMNAIGKINNGESLTGAANAASQVPLPYFATVPMMLRSVDEDTMKFLNPDGPIKEAPRERRDAKPRPEGTPIEVTPQPPAQDIPMETDVPTDMLEQIEDVSTLDLPEGLI